MKNNLNTRKSYCQSLVGKRVKAQQDVVRTGTIKRVGFHSTDWGICWFSVKFDKWGECLKDINDLEILQQVKPQMQLF